MAATWRGIANGIAYATNKSMIDLFNDTGSTQVIRVYRMWIWNSGTVAVSAAFNAMQIRRITAASSGATITPVAHDTNSSALNANTTMGTGRTTTATDVFRRFTWLVEEPTVTGVTQANWELLIPNAEVWSAGYGDTNVEPIVCRATYGVEIFAPTAVTSSSNDFEMEFTDAGS